MASRHTKPKTFHANGIVITRLVVFKLVVTWVSLVYLGAGPPLHHPEPGCLTLRAFRRVSTSGLDIRFTRHIQTLASRVIYPHAQPTPPLLRSWIAALYHHQLLPPAPPAWRPAVSRSVSAGTRTGPASLSFRGRWIRGHARAYPPSTGRTSARQSIAG